MKKVAILGLTIFCFSSLIAQTSKSQLHPFLFSSHGFNSIYLDPSGYNPVFSTFSGNPANSNPAGFSDDKKIHIWGKWAKNSEIKNAWFGFGYRQLKPEIPSGIGVSVPILGLSVTAGFTRSLNYTLYSEDISRTSPDDPYGSGISFDYYDDAQLDIFSLSFSGKMNLPGKDGNDLAFGLTLKNGLLKVKSTIDRNVMETDSRTISFSFGAICTLQPEFAEKLKVGFSFESEENYSGTSKYEDLSFGAPAGTYAPIIKDPIKFEANLPTRVHVGTEITYHSGIQALFQGSLLMRQTTGFLAKNQTELSGSVVFPVFDSVKISGGLLYDFWLKNEKESGSVVNETDFQSVFLTTGVHAGFWGVLIDISLADNHLFSGKYRKQTILTAGIGYEF